MWILAAINPLYFPLLSPFTSLPSIRRRRMEAAGIEAICRIRLVLQQFRHDAPPICDTICDTSLGRN